MQNPWTKVALDDYESHMALAGVYQLQTLDRLMGEQFAAYPVKSVAVMGVAGGNGLGHLIGMPGIEIAYGVDINAGYLEASVQRYPELAGRYRPVLADVGESCGALPLAELVIANLFIEYVGCECFGKAVAKMAPEYVSCVIQIDPADSFVSESPFTSKLGVLDGVHQTVDAAGLVNVMSCQGYGVLTDCIAAELPNGKRFRRIDFRKVRS